MTEGVIGNAETVRAKGMMPEMSRRWSAIRVQAIAMQAEASKINSSVSSVINLALYAVLIMGAGASAGRRARDQSGRAVRGFADLHPRPDADRPARRRLAPDPCGLVRTRRVEDILAIPLRPASMSLPAPEGRLVAEGPPILRPAHRPRRSAKSHSRSARANHLASSARVPPESRRSRG